MSKQNRQRRARNISQNVPLALEQMPKTCTSEQGRASSEGDRTEQNKREEKRSRDRNRDQCHSLSDIMKTSSLFRQGAKATQGRDATLTATYTNYYDSIFELRLLLFFSFLLLPLLCFALPCAMESQHTYLCWKAGGRFSTNAVIPSLRSSVAKVEWNSLLSKRIPSSKESSWDAFTASLAIWTITLE